MSNNIPTSQSSKWKQLCKLCVWMLQLLLCISFDIFICFFFSHCCDKMSDKKTIWEMRNLSCLLLWEDSWWWNYGSISVCYTVMDVGPYFIFLIFPFSLFTNLKLSDKGAISAYFPVFVKLLWNPFIEIQRHLLLWWF